MTDYGRDMDIGRPTDALDTKRAAVALQAIADLAVDAESMGQPSGSEDG